MTEIEAKAEAPSDRRRRIVRLVTLVAAWGLLALDVLGLVGFAVRDRTVLLALLMYLPLIPLGLASLVLDLLHRGRAVRGPRWLLAFVGLAGAAASSTVMIGRGPQAVSAVDAAAQDEVVVLHWNVLWGGRPSGEATWTGMEDAILGRTPDVVVLSEAPPGEQLDSLKKRLGPEWSSTWGEHDQTSGYWYRIAAFSRWPVGEGRRVPVRNGTALDVRIERPGRPIRLLVVDGQSKITQLRTPFLHDVAEACRKAADEGAPYDLIAGDFNAVGRSLGFDALRATAGGYEPAAASSIGWRASWPMPLPVFDIDHVWVHDGWRIRSCSLFASLSCDHRGQVVRLTSPPGQ
ncbi:endonuclease/exonuclease/phosphatase family protein [Paludisphaera rhizosphaerae]|uniref:endonuclease/exonuclease/phosphatase family protein n=1 Tax=Paludisphaera rhizosphaerae TaxID=2711216 RepID=UPI0013EDA28E|nr:endonuclease/exonuclease/phosphatase family protein [Paludisphaera rhizosphaerae]